MPAALPREVDSAAPDQLVTVFNIFVCLLFAYLTQIKVLTTPKPRLSPGPLPRAYFHKSSTHQRGDKDLYQHRLPQRVSTQLSPFCLQPPMVELVYTQLGNSSPLSNTAFLIKAALAFCRHLATHGDII